MLKHTMNPKMDKLAKTTAWFLLCVMHTAYSLPNDNQAVVEVRADSADINQETHKGIFINQVELDQGTTHLRANKATTEGNAKNQLIKATIFGDKIQQAHYWELVAEDKPVVHAYADIIDYFPEKHLIKLTGHARVEQGRNSFSAPIIVYDTLHHHVITEAKPGEKTVIIYHPEEKIKA